jgi:hypothetical protein
MRMMAADAAGPDAIAAFLESVREQCLAQSASSPLRQVLPQLDARLIDAGFESRLAALADAPREGAPVGLFDASNGHDPRGGFTLFVPEDYHETGTWPLVVALHGGFGHGAMAKSRRRRLPGGSNVRRPCAASSRWGLAARSPAPLGSSAVRADRRSAALRPRGHDRIHARALEFAACLSESLIELRSRLRVGSNSN